MFPRDNVWARFQRLSQFCAIKIDHSPDCWRVDIRRGRDEFIVCTGTELLDAVIEALDPAEARRWHQPVKDQNASPSDD